MSKVNEHLDELEFLTKTAGAQTVKRFVQRLPQSQSTTYVGSGKLEEIASFLNDSKVDMAIFDDELSPSQIRNIEKALPEVKILDRSNLILDIFASNARTQQARTQVELAQCQYLLPRLTRMWTHLSKQKGGIGMKGPGETEIETDRRVIRDKISKLRSKLEKIERQNLTQRQSRKGKKRVALVGYTNVGKSTIMNALCKTELLAEDKLFATLDASVKKLVLQDPENHYLPEVVLLSDTVGFIRKLPHMLVESFKSTLAEAMEADLILHVVDVSHPEFEDHIRVVNETLVEIGVIDRPTLMVFNKIDLYKGQDEGNDLENFMGSWMAKENAPAVFISAAERTNLEVLKDQILALVKSGQ